MKPSVVIGTESWLNDDITNGEVFPDNFVCYRKDMTSRGGGVFVLVDQSVPSSPIVVPSTVCEAVWCQLKLRSGESLSVCSFYRCRHLQSMFWLGLHVRLKQFKLITW